MEVHTAPSTTGKPKWWISNPEHHRKNFVSKYGHAIYRFKALEVLNNFYNIIIGRKQNRKGVETQKRWKL